MQNKFVNVLNVIFVVAVVLLAATVLYLARQIVALPDEARVSALVEERLTQQQERIPPAAQPSSLTEREISALIDKRLAERAARSEEELSARVEQGIVAFIEKQRRAEQERPRRLAQNVPPVNKEDHVRGNPNAPVALIEYSDFECPFCKRFHATLKKLVDESNGQIKWVYRHFPLEELHPVKAHKEAVASECAAELGGNDAFWKFADRFYELTPSNNRTDIDRVLPQIAREIGLAQTKFAACLTSGRHDQRVKTNYRNAVASGGNGTPWSIVVSKNGKKYPLSGAQPHAAVKQLVELALQEK